MRDRGSRGKGIGERGRQHLKGREKTNSNVKVKVKGKMGGEHEKGKYIKKAEKRKHKVIYGRNRER